MQLVIENNRVIGIVGLTHGASDMREGQSLHDGEGQIGWELVDGVLAAPTLRRLCITRDGVVQNVVMAQVSDLRLAPGEVAIENDEAGPGWTWTKRGGFAPQFQPVPAIPQSVTLAQARVALRRAGLFDQVDAAIRARGGEAIDAWEYSNSVSRTGELAGAIGAQLGLSAERIDELFILAASIEF